MSIEQLAETARAMVAPGKGIIAIDESTATIGKRFAGVGVENSEDNRRAYCEMLLTTPKLGEHISGAILYDETIRQSTRAGVPFTKVMLEPGESKTVTLTGDPRLLGRYDERAGRWRLSAGDYEVFVGKSAGEPVLTGRARVSGKLLGK